jgi:hypothetical protein
MPMAVTGARRRRRRRILVGTANRRKKILEGHRGCCHACLAGAQRTSVDQLASRERFPRDRRRGYFAKYKKENKPTKMTRLTKSEKSNHGSSMPSHEHRPTGKIDALCQWPPPPTISSPTRKQSSLSPNTHRKQAVAWSARLDRLAAEAHARMVKMEATLAAVEARGVLERVLAERVEEIVAAVRDCGTEKEAEPLERGSRSE